MGSRSDLGQRSHKLLSAIIIIIIIIKVLKAILQEFLYDLYTYKKT